MLLVCTQCYRKICLEQTVEVWWYYAKLVCDLGGSMVPNTKRTFPAAGKYALGLLYAEPEVKVFAFSSYTYQQGWHPVSLAAQLF